MDIKRACDKICETKYTYISSYDNRALECSLISDREEAKIALKSAIVDIFSDYQAEIATLSAKVYAYEAIIANSNFKTILSEELLKPLNKKDGEG